MRVPSYMLSKNPHLVTRNNFKMSKFIKLNPDDNVAVCLEAAPKGQTVEIDGLQLVLIDDIPVGHKVALQNLASGDDVIKYNAPIGHAIADIQAGNHVHAHNLKTNLLGNDHLLV